jgi:acyl-CoA synthetase (AMP-forming)/AMP-acid ligase II
MYGLVFTSHAPHRKALPLFGHEVPSVVAVSNSLIRVKLPDSLRGCSGTLTKRIILVQDVNVLLALRALNLLQVCPNLIWRKHVGGVTSLSHEEQFDHAASIGRPTPGVEVRIVDDEGADVKTGEPGELLVRVGQPGRYSVMRGYYNRPEETAQTIKDGWIHTGDIAKADQDGYLYIVDCKKGMVLSGGFNIYTKELERALLQNPQIADAAVVGVPDAVFGEAVVAFIEPQQGTAPTPLSVIEHVRNLVAGYKKPKYVFVVDVLPRNSLGKVLKRELRDQAIKLVEAVRAR